MINYSRLKSLLQSLEKGVVPTGGSFPSFFEVRANGKSTVQGFTLDSSTIGKDLPVVVAIGANYTQGGTSVPRDVQGSLGDEVEAKLTSCRTWLDRGFAGYRNNPNLWARRCAAQSPSLRTPIPGMYHLVMTKFCLWITKRSWSEIQSQIRADLLQNNARFRVGRLGVAYLAPSGRAVEGPIRELIAMGWTWKPD